jgi:hypothetical protein
MTVFNPKIGLDPDPDKAATAWIRFQWIRIRNYWLYLKPAEREAGRREEGTLGRFSSNTEHRNRSNKKAMQCLLSL